MIHTKKVLFLILLLTLCSSNAFADNINNYKVIFSNEKLCNIDSLKDYDLNKSIDGLILYDYKEIYVYTNTVQGINHVLNHEYGHALDNYCDDNGVWYCGLYSDTKEFNMIYEKEHKHSFADNIRNPKYFRNDIHEYFAESYAYYIENRLNKQSLTYEYINRIVQESN